MATGDTQDIVTGLKSALPRGWFSSNTPVLDTLLTGLATAWSGIYSTYSYVATQTRIRTATGVWLDLIATDFFGTNLPRKANEPDAQYRARILSTLLIEQGTRNGIYNTLLVLTGRAPVIFEPGRPADTGAYTQPFLNFINRWSNGVVRGNAQAVAANSITLAATDTSAADFYATSAVRIVAGAGAGQERKVVTSRRNLLSYSQALDNAAWIAYLCSTTANATTAPDGTVTAEIITSTAAAGSTTGYTITQWGTANLANQTLTFSIHLKIGTIAANSPVMIDLMDGFGNLIAYAEFDISTGAVLTTYPGGATTQNLGNGWFRGSITGTFPPGAVAGYQVVVVPAHIPIIPGETYYVWGAQLETGSSATEYIHTEANPAIVVTVDQPWSSNLLLNSANASTATYFKNTSTVVGDLITCTATADPNVGQSVNLGMPVGGLTFTFSVDMWVDAGQPTSGYMFYVYEGTATYIYTQNVTLTTTRTRYSFTVTLNSAATSTTLFARLDQQTGFSIGNNFHAANWQLETGNLSTPYIATSSSAIARPDATSVYDIAPSAYNASWPTNASLLGYGNAGAYGSLLMPYQTLVKAYLPATAGIPLAAGYGVLPTPVTGATNGAYNTPSSTEYALSTNAQIVSATNAIYQALDAAKPAGTIVWVSTSS